MNLEIRSNVWCNTSVAEIETSLYFVLIISCNVTIARWFEE